MLRVVLDTNVFISGVISKRGAAAQVLQAWRARQFLLVVSQRIISEIVEVLRYPRIQQKYGIKETDIEGLISLLEIDALVVPGLHHDEVSIPEDPADEMFLDCALDAEADCIVSGDQHLLQIGEFEGIPIISVREFLDRFLGERDE